MKFREDRWVGNKWESIDIDPVEAMCFLPLLSHLSDTYHFAFPSVVRTLDGFIAEFELLNSKAIILIDTWTFSIAFEKGVVRDQVLSALHTLPILYFGA